MKLRLCILIIIGLLQSVAFAESIQARFALASKVALSNPHDLKLSPDGKYLLVSDVGNNRVTILDPDSLQLVSQFGADHQSGTHDIDFDAQGRAYVADTHNNRVTIYQMNGLEASLVGELNARIRGPEGVLIHPNGQVYVAGAWSGNVVAYADGRVVGELKGLSSPHDLALAADGNIWLADAGNDRVLLLSPELEIRRELGRDSYDFNGVRYLDVREDGTLIAADKYTHNIKFIDPDGELLLVLGSGKPEIGVNKFTTPEGVEVDGNTLWLSDSGNDRVVKYILSND
ncbi:MAG: NHL repeat-containing protein [Gammaproteobacteria bacterium]|nr:NHL repeat-containing protein [Gammaproteobacteria bacterium]